MAVLGVPLEAAIGASVANQSQEQKEARGDLWKRPRYVRGNNGDSQGIFHSLFKESCHRIGYDPDDPLWSPGLHK